MMSGHTERFMRHVAKSADGCWLWTGYTNRGYGHFRFNGKDVLAHRWSYEQFVGPIPEGLQIDHLCRVPGCVNPAHLEPVTAKENTRRSFSPWGINARKTHCKWGHEFTPANTATRESGKRKCRACHCRRQAAYLARRAA